MKRSEIVKRAKHALQHSKAVYRLGKGGFRPEDPLPEDKNGGCDCSGFVSWCLGVSRWVKDPFITWIETTAVVRDAKSKEGIFTIIKDPVPGDLLVFGDAKGSQGHIGVVSEVKDGEATKVIHCSSGASRRTGRAITETGPAYFFQKGAVYVRYDKSEADEPKDKTQRPDAPGDRDCVM